MMIGDFVELSAAAKRTMHRNALRGKRGIITRVRPVSQMWEVSWFMKNKTWMQIMHRDEIKHVRKSK